MRRGGRVAEGGGLLNRYTGLTRIVSSNLISSAKTFDATLSLAKLSGAKAQRPGGFARQAVD